MFFTCSSTYQSHTPELKMVIILCNSVHVSRTLLMITMDEKIMVSFAEHPQLLEFPSLKAGVGQNKFACFVYSHIFFFVFTSFFLFFPLQFFSGPLPTQSDAYLYQQFEKLYFYLR